MERVLFLLIGFILVLTNCNKEDVLSGNPDCIERKIYDIAEGEVWNPPAKVYSYMYNGEIVYYFPSRCCDIPSILYDKNCNAICSPDGGITGDGNGQCSDFFNFRTNEKLIWDDIRE